MTLFSAATARYTRQCLPYVAAAAAAVGGAALFSDSPQSAPKAGCDNTLLTSDANDIIHSHQRSPHKQHNDYRLQHEESSSQENINNNKETSKNRIIFLGTGSSTGCPMPRCPLLFSTDASNNETLATYQSLLKEKCHVSNLAGEPRVDPKHNRNYRNNPSLLVSHTDKATGVTRNIVIDTGKTFRESALRWFPIHKIATLDAVILTHEHADACFGLDDLRGFQAFDLDSLRQYQVTKARPQQIPMPLFLSQPCLNVVSQQFPWLFPSHQVAPKQQPCSCQTKDEDGKPVVARHVASLDVQVFQAFQPFEAAGLKVTPLPILHGEDLVSYGFAFTVGETNIVYLSDISRMLPETLTFIQEQLPPTDVLIVDTLHPDKEHPVHYSLQQAVDLSLTIQPRQQTLLVGMNCDSFAPHDEANRQLRQDYPGSNVQLAHDGLQIDC